MPLKVKLYYRPEEIRTHQHLLQRSQRLEWRANVGVFHKQQVLDLIKKSIIKMLHVECHK